MYNNFENRYDEGNMKKNIKISTNSIGKIIREAREKEEMSVEDLVWKIGNPKITIKTIKNFEKGKEFPDLDMIYKLSEILNLNPNELLEMRNIIRAKSCKEPNWAARNIGGKLLNLVKPAYYTANVLLKILVAIMLVLLFKYIHSTYEATDNPVVIQTQQILGNYLDNENNEVVNDINN